MLNNIYQSLTERKRLSKKSFAVLIDPDKVNDNSVEDLIKRSLDAKVDYFLASMECFIKSSTLLSFTLSGSIRTANDFLLSLFLSLSD